MLKGTALQLCICLSVRSVGWNLPHQPAFPACYWPKSDAQACMQVGIQYNAGMTTVMAGLAQQGGSYDLCLQGFGVVSKGISICSGLN